MNITFFILVYTLLGFTPVTAKTAYATVQECDKAGAAIPATKTASGTVLRRSKTKSYYQCNKHTLEGFGF